MNEGSGLCDFLEKAERAGGVVFVASLAVPLRVTLSGVCQTIQEGMLSTVRAHRCWFVPVSELGREAIEAQKRLSGERRETRLNL